MSYYNDYDEYEYAGAYTNNVVGKTTKPSLMAIPKLIGTLTN